MRKNRSEDWPCAEEEEPVNKENMDSSQPR